MDEAHESHSRPERADRRHELVRRRRAQRPRGVYLAVIGTFILVIAGIVVAAYVVHYVLPNRQLVARVNDVSFTRGDLVKTVRVQQLGAKYFGQEFRAGTEVFQQLQVMIENEMLVQLAPRYGIHVTEDELDSAIRAIVLSGVTGGANMDTDQLDREFREKYNTYLNALRMSEKDHREFTRRSLVRAKFREFIGERVPYVAPQVHYYRLVMSFGDEVDIMLTKFKDATASDKSPENLHKAFHDIVREFSRDDAETVRLGGDMGWIPSGVLQPYGDLIYGLEAGVLSDPIPDNDNPKQVLFFMVSERAEARTLDPDDRETLKTNALTDWINGQREEHDVFVDFNSEVYDWVFAQLRISATPTPTPERSGVGNLGF